MKGTVYKYTFSDNKVYIGQTRHAALRHKEHLDKTSGPTNSAFWEAYQRLGEPEYEILFENEFENEFELESALNIIETIMTQLIPNVVTMLENTVLQIKA